jgi:hypothetical protein
MDDRVHVRRIHSLLQPGGGYRFDVEIESSGQMLHVVVGAPELLDFDQFQAAALAQTGWLVMAPCGPGAEGPDHYRRHRRVWCSELQAAAWVREPEVAASATKPTRTPATSGATPNAVPKPKTPELRGQQSIYRLG